MVLRFDLVLVLLLTLGSASCARDDARGSVGREFAKAFFDPGDIKKLLAAEHLLSLDLVSLDDHLERDRPHLDGEAETSLFNLADGSVMAIVGPFQAQELEPATHVFIHLDPHGTAWKVTDLSVHWAFCVSSRWRADVTGSVAAGGDTAKNPSLSLHVVIGSGAEVETMDAFIPSVSAGVSEWHKHLVMAIAREGTSVDGR